MRAGALRNVITIEQEIEGGRDTMNAKVVLWTAWREGIFCEKTSRRGMEHFDPTTKQRFSQTVYRFRCRYLDVAGLTELMRIDHEGQKYNIRGILPDDQRRDDVIVEATLQGGILGGLHTASSTEDEDYAAWIVAA